MATPRTDKTTIPENKDPLAGVSYSQPKPQPPINNLINDTTREPRKEPTPEGRRKPEAKADEAAEHKTPKGKVTVLMDNDLLERLRNAAYWKRKTLATLAEEGLRLVVERLERQHGGPFEPREEDLKTGRPQGTKNGTAKAR
jgi:hypothetical protein